MTNLDHVVAGSSKSNPAKFVLPIFAVALFLSAFLIFVVQPMFAKMVLPLLGGAPAVWNTAMVFFQASLLGGYLYAHLLVNKVPAVWQPSVHIGIMALGAFSLPFVVNTGFLPQPDSPIAPAVILLFAVSIGFPFFALSANAPLLQSWFSRSGHKDADDPYFLYGASNIGSVLALLSYPIVIEPFLPIQTQATLWALGYILLAATILFAARLARRSNRDRLHAPLHAASSAKVFGTSGATSKTISWSLRLRWIAAAAIPSSLMLGATTNITTNVAAAPFLWVLPLALYLGTFILVFDRKASLPMRWIGWLHTFLLITILVFGFLLRSNISVAVVFHLAMFFTSALICHADLASRRPEASNLTEFYLCMSFGGVLGGSITALFAPLLFSTIFEYPLMIAAACLFLPGAIGRTKATVIDVGFGVLVFAMAFAIATAGMTSGGGISGKMPFGVALLVLLPIAYCVARNRPVRAAATALAVAAAIHFYLPGLTTVGGTKIVSQERSFFGAFAVKAVETELGVIHKFAHGDTVHNIQLRTPADRKEPLAYYSVEGPFGDVIRGARAVTPQMSVAAIGLGAGALACHSKTGEDWVFYEIDPAVVTMATNPALFSYMSDCAPNASTVLGDARLTLAHEEDARFDLIIVDAFASNSIPAHLLTVEAITLYRQKLKPDGLLFFHVSNRFADVASVAIAGAKALGVASRHIDFQPDVQGRLFDLKSPVNAVAIGEEPVLSAALDGVSTWSRMAPNPAVSAWRDDWSNVVGALIAQARGGPQSEPALSSDAVAGK